MEIMVSLVILGITLIVSLPAFGRLMQSNNLQNAAGQVAGHFRLARSMAVANGISYIVGWDEANSRYDITRDDNGNDTPDVGEPVIGPYPMPRRTHVTNPDSIGFAADQVVFRRDGSASASGTLILSNDEGRSMNLILLAPTGQVRTH